MLQKPIHISIHKQKLYQSILQIITVCTLQTEDLKMSSLLLVFQTKFWLIIIYINNEANIKALTMGFTQTEGVHTLKGNQAEIMEEGRNLPLTNKICRTFWTGEEEGILKLLHFIGQPKNPGNFENHSLYIGRYYTVFLGGTLQWFDLVFFNSHHPSLSSFFVLS